MQIALICDWLKTKSEGPILDIDLITELFARKPIYSNIIHPAEFIPFNCCEIFIYPLLIAVDRETLDVKALNKTEFESIEETRYFTWFMPCPQNSRRNTNFFDVCIFGDNEKRLYCTNSNDQQK